VKTAGRAEEKGFHGGKKVKGRSRQIAADTGGRLWALHIHAANKADTAEGCAVADEVTGLPRLEGFCADEGYRGIFADHVRNKLGKRLHITGGVKGQGFRVIPKRWIVERTFGWFGWWRRLSKDYEHTANSAGAFVWIASMHRLLRADF
jgi:putative transposase